MTKGIEVGHIFQLGQKYSEAMGATFLDSNGKAQPFYMGCYGIGVSRLVAVMVETSHDEKGCIWHKSVTPYDVSVIISNIKDEQSVSEATKLYESLKAKGLKVLLDDRNERYGFKMSDFELLGFPYAVVVGKELKDGKMDIIKRNNLEKLTLHVDEVEEFILRDYK